MEHLERDLQALNASKDAWARLSIERKIAMLEVLKRSVHALAPQWVEVAAQAKGLEPNSPLAGEEWISGPWAVLYALNRYERTLAQISRAGAVRLPRKSAFQGPGGRRSFGYSPMTSTTACS